METFDYLKKQIDELTKVLKKLIKEITTLKVDGRVDETIEIINKGLLEGLNMNLEEITNSPLEYFISSITADDKLSNQNLDLLADLFFRVGVLLQKQDDREQAKRLFNRSLLIYEYLLRIEIDFSYERHLRLKELKEYLLQ